MQQTKSLLQVPTIDVQRIIQLPLDDIPGLVQAEIVFNGANIDKANIVVAVWRGKSLCTTARLDTMDNPDIFTGFNFL